MTLLKVRFNDERDSRYDSDYKFAETLRATGGWPEIETAINAAPKLVLVGKSLKDALRKAE
jgi:hypothetical protein